MAATGKTVNFELPLYNAGDAVSDLASFNSAMNQIDSQMEKNAVAAEAANGGVTSLTTQLNKVQGDITTLQTSVEQANGNAVGALNQIQEIVQPTIVTFIPVDQSILINSVYRNDAMFIVPQFTRSSGAALTQTLTVGGYTYTVVGKIDNANPLRIPTNVSIMNNYILWQHTTQGTLQHEQARGGVYYDGVNSYLLILNSLQFTTPYDSIYAYPSLPIALYNSQPKQP